MILFTVIIVGFDIAYFFLGIVPPLAYYVSDFIQATVYVVLAVLMIRRSIPPRWAPAAFATSMVVSNLALNFQYRLVGYSAVGVILLLLASYGAIVMMWRPFLISAVIMGGVTTVVLIDTDPVNGQGWVVTTYTALAISTVLLFGRRNSALQLATANQRIEDLATRDQLTGLLNRHGLEQALPLMTAVARRKSEPMFVAFLDVVGLKQVNDRFGHLAGDEVLACTAEALQRQARSADLLCRWGGDEFLVVGIGEAPDADALTARMMDAIDRSALEGRWTPAVRMGTASSLDPDLDALVTLADEDMYARRSATVRTED